MGIVDHVFESASNFITMESDVLLEISFKDSHLSLPFGARCEFSRLETVNDPEYEGKAEERIEYYF